MKIRRKWFLETGYCNCNRGAAVWLAYSSGFAVYEAHADATSTTASDDQIKKKPSSDGIELPGLGGSTGVSSGSMGGEVPGTTLGAGTTLSNPSNAIDSAKAGLITTKQATEFQKVYSDFLKQ